LSSGNATYDPLYRANIQSDLGDIYLEQGKNAEAQPLYEQALNIRKGNLQADNPELIATLNKLAQVYSRQREYDQAEVLLKQVLATRERQLEPDHPNIAEVYNSLALLYQEWGKEDLAKPLHELSEKIREKNSSLEHSDKDEANKLEDLQEQYTDLKKYDRAEILYKRELALREKMLGPQNPDLAVELKEMASFYVEQKRYSEAEPLYERALRIEDDALKGAAVRPKQRQGLQVALIETLQGTANVYFEQGRYTEAKPLYKRALEIREALYGADSLAVAEDLGSLAQLYLRLNEYNDAESSYKRLLFVWRKRLEAYKQQKPDARSFGDDRDLFTVCLPDPDNPGARSGISVDLDTYLRGSNELAAFYTQHARYAEAEDSYKESLATLDWVTTQIKVASIGISSNKYYTSDPFVPVERRLTPHYYETLAATLDAYASLIRKADSGRGAEALQMETRAKDARATRAKLEATKDTPR